MKKDRILKKLTKKLENKGYSFVIVRNMHTCIDILAKKLDYSLAIKVVHNIDAATKYETESLGKIASLFEAEPLIVGAVSKDKALDHDVVYQRFSTNCISEDSFEMMSEHRVTYLASKTVGVKVGIEASKLRYFMKLSNTSTESLAKKVGVSKDTIYKYGTADNFASLKTANKIERALNADITAKAPQEKKGAYTKTVTLANTRMSAIEMSNAPFDFAARSLNYYEISYDANARTMSKRAELFKAMRETFEGNYPFFVSRSRGGKIKGVPMLSRSELAKVESETELINLLTS